ncbi:LysR family transcriptional regulator [Pseudomonas sp. S31]|uniref:LysR family transcriptional regulator n=1 Tax=Pseudomonas sp. S31 TaxID=1564473 RepID=UPI001914C931|nr:LysR family transcriptional regulator [Pseudomonas sp. S31]MBK4998236.1 LysR family transcriptional regulator [Pseudomonas sp. S31]
MRDLSYFIKVAQLGHLSRAAEALHISPSALSKCIDRLETQYAAELFQRVGRSIRLTEAGRLLLDNAVAVERLLDQTQRQTASLGQGLSGSVRVGAAATSADYLLPAACSALQKEAPAVVVELQIGMNDVLREQLRKDQLDIVVGPLGQGDDELQEQQISSDEVVVVAHRSHPLAGRVATLGCFAEYRWLLSPPTVATRQWLDAAFLGHGQPAPAVAIVTNAIAAAPQLIAETGLLSFVSRRNLGTFGRAYDLVEIPVEDQALTLHRRFGILHRAGSYLSPATTRFMTLLAEAG